MAYSRPFIKLTFGGSLAGAQDEWVCGINLGFDSIIPNIPGNNFLSAFNEYAENKGNELPGLFKAYIENPDMSVPNGARLQFVKLAPIGTDGQYMADAKEFEVLNTTGGKSGWYAPQNACVITMTSDKRKDPGRNQRFYLPFTAGQGSGSGIDDTARKASLTATLLNNIKYSTSVIPGASVIQPAAVTTSDKITGDYLPITAVRVGNRVDTQRRRRNKLIESYAVTKLVDA